MKRVPVAKHHWSLKQLEYCFGHPNERINPSTPQRYSEIAKIAHSVDRSFCMKRGGVTLCHNIPNYPFYLAKTRASSVKKEENKLDRRANVQNMSISTRKEKEDLKLKSAFKKLTFEECVLMKKITDS